MAQNVQQVWFESFVGGVNDALPRDQIGEDQCVSIVNMLPMRNGNGLDTRGGARTTSGSVPASFGDILCVHTVTKTSGLDVLLVSYRDNTGRPQVSAIYDGGSGFSVTQINSDAWTLGGSRVFASSIKSVSMAGWDGNRVFLSDGVSGLYTVDLSVVNSSAALVRVYNKNWDSRPYGSQVTTADYVKNVAGTHYYKCITAGTTAVVADPSGSWTTTTGGQVTDGTAVWRCEGGTDAPSGLGLTQHKGRLWMFSGGTVYFCGTDDTQSARWENWEPYSGSAPDQTVVDDGGSMIVMPYGTDVTALIPSLNGLFVCKERSISLWNYPDAAAPWEVQEGATIDIVVSDRGCVDSDSVVHYADTALFLGRDSSGRLTLYRLNGTDIEDMSADIPSRMRSIDHGGIYRGRVLDDVYYLTDQSGLALAFDIRHEAWFDLESIQLGWIEPMDGKLAFLDSSCVFGRYPFGNSGDGNGDVGITYSIATREIRPRGAYGQFRSREVYCEAGSSGSASLEWFVLWNGRPAPLGSDTGDSFSVSSSAPKFDDDVNYDSGAVFGGGGAYSTMFRANDTGRGEKCSIAIRGVATSPTFINKIGFGYHGRTGKT